MQRVCRWAVLVVLCGLNLSVTTAARELVTTNPNKVEAAFLRHFAHYVSWPSNVFEDKNSPWKIGILGPDPFGDILERTLKDRTEQGRPFRIFRADSPDKLPSCQIVFIAYKDAEKRRAALKAFRNEPVLTVGNASGFLQEGGIIRFEVGERVEMSINLDQARSVSLEIQTKMLEVSYAVLENGAMCRLR